MDADLLANTHMARGASRKGVEIRRKCDARQTGSAAAANERARCGAAGEPLQAGEERAEAQWACYASTDDMEGAESAPRSPGCA